MYKRLLLFTTALCLFFVCNKTYGQSVSKKSGKPNVIFVLVDDMGYGDLPLYGNAGVNTPNLDRLAEEGIRFTAFYVNSPICSPSRAAFTTGQYPLRWNITSYLADSARNIRRGMDQYLNPKAPSLARILQAEGYYTAHVGKWHLGGQRNVHGAPLITDFGFHTSYTSFEGLGERLGWEFETQKWNGSNKFPLSVEQEKLGHGSVTYIKRHDEPRVYVERALQEIDKAQAANKPFYLNLWPSDVHLPVEARPELRGDGSVASQYAGVIVELDRQLGRIFERVRKDPNLKDNTIIVFTSDNGAAPGAGSTGGLRGRKGQLYEGGIRSPFIVWAPKLSEPSMVGKVNKTTVLAGIDLLPTVLSFTGVKAASSIKFDGLDMSSTWFGKTLNKRDQPVMWIRPPDTRGQKNEFQDLAIRKGKWKLLTDIDGKHTELFDIESNPGETIELAAANPAVVTELKKQVLDWFYGIRTRSAEALRPWQSK